LAGGIEAWRRQGGAGAGHYYVTRPSVVVGMQA